MQTKRQWYQCSSTVNIAETLCCKKLAKINQHDFAIYKEIKH